MSKLTKRHKLFIDEYMKDRNATQAAIRSGYAANSAQVQGPRLLGNDRIKKEIEKRIKKATENVEVTQEQVIRELAKGAFADLDVSQMKYSDKLKCLEMLAKNLGMLDGKANGSGKDKNAITERLFSALDSFAQKRGVRGSES